MPTTWGDPALSSSYAGQDSGIAKRLKASGAVLIGKTNIPANLGDWETDNPLYGGTRNPFDQAMSAGGSSGGSAAAVACGFSYGDVGSDQGGSVRLPAHYCGVNGLKPTWNILPMSGHSMTGELRVPDIGVSGPIARQANDISLMLNALAGAEENNSAWQLRLPKSKTTTLRNVRFAAMLDHPECPVDVSYRDALEHLLETLERSGARVDRGARPGIDFDRANDLMNLLVRAETSTRLNDQTLKEKRRILKADASHASRFDILNARGETMSHRDWLLLHEERLRLYRAWDAFFGEFDFFLCPVSASAAAPFRKAVANRTRTIPVNGTELPVLAQHFWFSFASLAYMPANAAPFGHLPSGLPVGVQVLGARFRDHDVASVSGLIQQATKTF